MNNSFSPTSNNINVIHKLCQANDSGIYVTDVVSGSELMQTRKVICFGTDFLTHNLKTYVFCIDIPSLYIHYPSISTKLTPISEYDVSTSISTDAQHEIELANAVATQILQTFEETYVLRYVFYSDTHNEFVSFFTPIFIQKQIQSTKLVLIGDPEEAKFNLWNKPTFGINEEDDDKRSKYIEHVLLNLKNSIYIHGNHDWTHAVNRKFSNFYTRIVIVNKNYQLIAQHSLLSTDGENIIERLDKTIKNGDDTIICWKLNFSKSRYKSVQDFVTNIVPNNEFSIYNYLTAPCYLRCISNPYNTSSEESMRIDVLEQNLQKSLNESIQHSKVNVGNVNTMTIIGHSFDFSMFPYLITKSDNEKKIPLFKGNSRKCSLWATKASHLSNGMEVNENSRQELRTLGLPMLANLYEADGDIYGGMLDKIHKPSSLPNYHMLKSSEYYQNYAGNVNDGITLTDEQDAFYKKNRKTECTKLHKVIVSLLIIIIVIATVTFIIYNMKDKHKNVVSNGKG